MTPAKRTGLLLAAATATLPFGAAQAQVHNVMTWLLEDATCGRDFAAVPYPPKPTKRAVPRVPPGIFDRGRDGAAAFTLAIDDKGVVSGVTAQSDSYGSAALEKSFAASFASWQFAPGAPGTYCIDARIDFPPIHKPWDNPADPQAPPPTATTPLDYPDGATATGTVLLAIEIDRQGAVRKAAVISEDPDGQGFGQLVSEAVVGWRFATASPGHYRLTVQLKPPPPASAPP